MKVWFSINFFTVESKPQHCLLRGVLVDYDITRLPPYDEGIGSPTRVICSHASVATSGKTILRSDSQSPIRSTKHLNIKENTNIVVLQISISKQ